MIIVAYLYNTNGMASWCWEAAHALAEAGQAVTLVCAPGLDLPETSQVNVLRFAPPQSALSGSKIARELNRVSSKSSEFVFHLHTHLEQVGIVPTVYLLNQSDLLDVRVNVPQHVVAWAYPTSLAGYVLKVNKIAGRKPSLNTIRVLLDAVGWWRKDWQSYRTATSVLAVTERLRVDISKAGVPVYTVHPGTAVRSVNSCPDSQTPCRIVICAQDLEDSRKRILFLLKSLENIPPDKYRLTLVGQAGDRFKETVRQKSLSLTFTGPQRRDDVQRILAESDIFLFGSCLDDWGYVLVEAMGQGLCVVAPNIPPFDEIVGDCGVLYSAFSTDDLHTKISSLLDTNLKPTREAAQARAVELFSRNAFSKRLMSAAAEEKGV